MVNSDLLELKIKEVGKTKTFLANKLGKTLQSLNLKIKNKYDFTSNELGVLVKELGITTMDEMESIFFANEVDN